MMLPRRTRLGVPVPAVVTIVLLFAASLCRGQGLGDVAARERAKRSQAKAKAPAVVVTNDDLPSTKPAEAQASAPEGAKAVPAAAEPADAKPAETTPAETKPDPPAEAEKGVEAKEDAGEPKGKDLPWCAPGLEMLKAWAAAHQEHAGPCGRPMAETSGDFEIEIVVSGGGSVQDAVVTPRNAYTSCVARSLRGRPMPTPANGKPCRARYTSHWRL